MAQSYACRATGALERERVAGVSRGRRPRTSWHRATARSAWSDSARPLAPASVGSIALQNRRGGAGVRAVGGVSGVCLHRRLRGLRRGLGLSVTRLVPLVEERRNGDRGQQTDDQHHDQELDQRETRLALGPDAELVEHLGYLLGTHCLPLRQSPGHSRSKSVLTPVVTRLAPPCKEPRGFAPPPRDGFAFYTEGTGLLAPAIGPDRPEALAVHGGYIRLSLRSAPSTVVPGRPAQRSASGSYERPAPGRAEPLSTRLTAVAARRLILVMLVLLLLSSIAAAAAPGRARRRRATTRPARRPTPLDRQPGAELSSEAIAAGDAPGQGPPRPRRRARAHRDLGELADQVEIAAFGELEDVDPGLPGPFRPARAGARHLRRPPGRGAAAVARSRSRAPRRRGRAVGRTRRSERQRLARLEHRPTSTPGASSAS